MVISNFRSCRETMIAFEEDITVLVGESGSGKSNIIDAIQLATLPVSGRHPNYFQAKRDLTRTCLEGEIIAIQQHFSDLTEAEKSVFLTTITDDSEDLVYSTKYDTRRTCFAASG
jgi:putative ATP-dependent endonuclease of OLD family